MRKIRKLITAIIVSITFLWVNCGAQELKIGMSTALTGPLKEVGQDMRLGFAAYFDKINREGGVNGNTLKLIVKDDGYEPRNAAVNMRELIDEEQVIAVVGNVGTPTAIVSVPIAIEKKTLFFGALTGAGLLRKPEYKQYVVNYRASYAEETASMVQGLLTMGIKPEEIAFFTQKDSYGEAGFKGAVKALEENGFARCESLVHGRYTRNTLNVEDAVAELLDADIEPKAVIMVGSYLSSAKFIQMARLELPRLLFLNVSFVGSEALVAALDNDAEDVIVTQVVPPFNSTLRAAIEYQTDLEKFSPESNPGFVSFEGYIGAKIFVKALSMMGSTINRESLAKSFQNLKDIDVGIGVNLSYGGNHNGVEKVWPTIYRNKQFEPVNWVDLGSSYSLDMPVYIHRLVGSDDGF